MSHVSALYHIVFNTFQRNMTLNEEHSNDMYHYIWKMLENRGCVLYRINGTANHIHMLIDLKPTLALSKLVGEVKQATSEWARTSGLFPLWHGWGHEYAAFSVSYHSKDVVIDYIKSQRTHHATTTYEEELKRLSTMQGLGWNDLWLT